jgi:hypothetical protein
MLQQTQMLHANILVWCFVIQFFEKLKHGSEASKHAECRSKLKVRTGLRGLSMGGEHLHSCPIVLPVARFAVATGEGRVCKLPGLLTLNVVRVPNVAALSSL